MDSIRSQIIRLTKSILLNPEDKNLHSSSFFAGRKYRSSLMIGGVGLTWWYSSDSLFAANAVADLTINQNPNFRGCDIETASDVVMRTLQEVCTDKDIFDGDSVAFRRKENLFECRSVSVESFAEEIQSEIIKNIQKKLGKLCVVFVVPRFQVDSFRIVEDSIRVVSRNDQEAWRCLEDEGYEFSGWSPSHPSIDPHVDRAFGPPDNFECVLIAEEQGTRIGAETNGVLKFRQLSALMFAVASRRAGHPLFVSSAKPSRAVVQFPHVSNMHASFSGGFVDPIVPNFGSGARVITSDDIAELKTWYASCHDVGPDSRSRLEKGAYFLNRGINSRDIEAYVNYFVALDALFGKRGSVESSILEGLRSLDISKSYLEKASWLFELRSELVHGGSRIISEWPRHTRYVKHFRSTPMVDVQSLALQAVLRAPYRISETQ